MKTSSRIVPAVALALGFSAIGVTAQKAPADDAHERAGWSNLTIILELYALDRDSALTVLDSEDRGTARYSRVRDLVKAGKARLDTLSAITTKSGQRGVLEASDEVRYATEFAAPPGKGALAPPLAFDTRNAGDNLEIEPVFESDSGPPRCHLNFVPQKVTLLGFRDSYGMDGDSPVGQPLFQVQKVTTGLAIPINEAHFFGTMNASGERGPSEEMCLAFVRANVSGPMADDLKPRDPPLDWSVLNVEYRLYSMERAAARDILASSATLRAPWARLEALVREKKARCEHHLHLQTKSGQRSVVEEHREVRYGTAMLPASSERKTERSTRQEPAQHRDEKAPAPIETTTVSRELPPGEIHPGAPTKFETRNAGFAVEIEPVVGPDGLTVDLNHVPYFTTHLGDLQPTGIAARYPPQPLFETRRLVASQNLLTEEWTLVGTFSPPGATGVNGRTDDGRTSILFVRATPQVP